MNKASDRIVKTYVSLTLLSTFASSFIWGINTLFLLDAGLTISQAFIANAFFTAGQVLFEIPTGIVADTRGRRMSFLLGTATLFLTTLAYLWLWKTSGPFWGWAVVSMLLGLGFTFYSGATEAWLVDGLKAAGYKGELDGVFAKGSIATGFAMLTGTVAGGLVAQMTNLGVPYIMRIVALGLTFLIALFLMHDEGFSPKKGDSFLSEIKTVAAESVNFGLRNAPIRWLMLSSLFSGGVGIFAFYAMQPYLLQLYGTTGGYVIAGIAAAIVAGAQIVGGFLVPYAGKLFKRRTSILITGTVVSTAALLLIAVAGSFLDRAFTAGRVVGDLCRSWARPAVIRKRHHPVRTPSDRPLGRQSAHLSRRSYCTANAWKGGRILGLPGVVHWQRSVSGPRLTVPFAGTGEKAKSDPIRGEINAKARA